MARFNFSQNSFLTGELSPRLVARPELTAIRNGCEELFNMLVYPQGGAYRRPGTQFKESQVTRNGGQGNLQTTSRLIPFIISPAESYILIIDLEKAGDIVDRFGVLYNTQTSSEIGGTFQVNFDGNGVPWTKYTTGQQLREIQFAQVNNLLFLVNPGKPPMYIQRNGVNSFFLPQRYSFPFSFSKSASGFVYAKPFENKNLRDDLVITASGTTSSETLTLTSGIPGTDVDFFTASDVNTIMRISDGTLEIAAIITATAGSLIATIDGVQYFDACTASTVGGWTLSDGKSVGTGITFTAGMVSGVFDWAMSSWSDLRGWPRTIASFEGRLIYGGNAKNPDTIWGTAIGNIQQLVHQPFIQDTTTFGIVLAL